MQQFFQNLGVIDEHGKPTKHFGDLSHVYLKFCKARSDPRENSEILKEAEKKISAAKKRGVFLSIGHGDEIWQHSAKLNARLHFLYEDSKNCLRQDFPPNFFEFLRKAQITEDCLLVKSKSSSRSDYILHPFTGEKLTSCDVEKIARLWPNVTFASRPSPQIFTEEKITTCVAEKIDHVNITSSSRPFPQHVVQLVVSDGLNVSSLTDENHLLPYLQQLKLLLGNKNIFFSPTTIIVSRGRVRIGYRIGEILFGGILTKQTSPVETATIIHVIGERPGNGHHTFSAYLTSLHPKKWCKKGKVDHHQTKVVSDIADTALNPIKAAFETVTLLFP